MGVKTDNPRRFNKVTPATAEDREVMNITLAYLAAQNLVLLYFAFFSELMIIKF